MRAGQGPEPAVGCELAELAGPRLGAEPVGVAVEDEHRLGHPLDGLLEPVGEVDAQRVPDPAHARSLALGGVLGVEVGRLERVVAPPGEEDLAEAAEGRVDRRTRQYERTDDVGLAGGDMGGDLGAAGVPDEDDALQAGRGQPLDDGVGELGDVHRVRRLAAAGEAGQLDQVRAGPGAERIDGRLQVVRDGEAGDDDDLGDAGPRRAGRAAAHDAPAGGAVLQLDRHAGRR